MGLLKKHIDTCKYPYDPSKEEPFLHANTCNRETVVGFREKGTGKFHEVMMITSDKELEEFKKTYGIVGDIRMF